MWPAGVAGGLQDEARENEGLLYGLEHGEKAVGMRWERNVKGNRENLFESGYNESNPAERRAHPGYSPFETRGSNGPDWRDVTIVSSFYTFLYIYNAVARPSDFLHAGLCQLTAPLCAIQFLLFTVIHLFVKELAHNISPLFYTTLP